MKRQPGDRAVAPGPLALVQAFVNSVNVEFGPDYLATVEGLTIWLERNGLGDPRVEPGELDRRDAVTLREALRALLRENNGGPPDLQARRTIEHIARDCPLVVGFEGETGELGLRPALTDVRGALARVLAAVAGAVADGSWQRLKACGEHRCEWIFYDRSRNKGSRWCSMAVCGTRSKMRTYRETKRVHSESG
ncbi:CGNR zinc finger domain-containing protein [Streptosporangium sp. NPDC000563]|uniref:CGNR zinc finger domain-containing protein n=1 Tax=unclassified Streptosporangium TaxID=2632669 RepID=UPI003321499F